MFALLKPFAKGRAPNDVCNGKTFMGRAKFGLNLQVFKNFTDTNSNRLASNATRQANGGHFMTVGERP
jgi:hypothetical protein